MWKQRGVRLETQPEALRNKPDLSEFLQEYLEAWYKLHRRRQVGYGHQQPLVSSEIVKYARDFGFDQDLDFFYEAMTGMDDVFLKKQNDDLEAKAAKNKKPGAPGKRPRKGR